jgi:hypothetical protein
MITSKTLRRLTATAAVLVLSACGEDVTGPGGIEPGDYDDNHVTQTTQVSRENQSHATQPTPGCASFDAGRTRGNIPVKNCGSGEVDPLKP